MEIRKTHQIEVLKDGHLWIATVDDVTKEVLSEIPAVRRRNTNSYFKKGDFYTVHKRLNKMLKEKTNYNNLTFRLLFELLDRIELNNRISTFRQEELAQILRAHQPKISASLKVLEKDEVIKKVKHDYFFTPKFVRYVNDSNFINLHEEYESPAE